MKKLFLLVLLLVYSTTLYPQNIKLFLPQGYMLESLNGCGYSKTFSNVSNISSCNPASLYSLKSFAAGVSYQYDSPIDEGYIAGIGFSKSPTALPQSAGLALAFDNFRFGAGLSQRFNCKPTFDAVEIATIDQPDGTGELYSPKYDYKLLSYSLIISYSFQKAFSNQDRLSLGLRINRDRFSMSEVLDMIEANVFSYGWSFALGASYGSSLPNNIDYNLGFYFEKGANISGNAEYKGQGLYGIIRDSTLNRPVQYYKIDNIAIPFSANAPDRLILSGDISPVHNIKIVTDVSYVFWHSVYDIRSDQFEISASGILKTSENLSFSAGIISIPYDNSSLQFFTNKADVLNAFFITAGTVIRFGVFELNLALADSHLFSGEWHKQSILKGSLEFYL